MKLKKLFVIDSKASKQTKQLEYDFRSYRYIILQMLFNLQNSIKSNICVDTECDMSLIDRQFLKNILSNKEIYIMSIAIAIRDIDDRSHILSKYIDLNIWILESNKNDSIMTYIRRKVHIVNDLRVNLLLDTDAIMSENMTINYLNNQLSMTSCEDFVIVININLIDSRVDRVIRIKAVIRLTLNAMIEVSIQIREEDNLSSRRDYLFQSATSIELKSENDVFAHVINANINFVQIRNTITESVVLSRYVKLERI